MARKRDWILGGAIGGTVLVILFVAIVALYGLISREGIARYGGRGEIALVEVTGLIGDAEPIVDQLRRYTKDNSVRGIVLRIDSPGGGAAASQEIYEAVKRATKAGKRVVASLGPVAASGGYYVACAAETIVANPATITGSIGVIMEIPTFQVLLKKIGIGFEVIKSGEHKDMASPLREMTEGERQLLQSVIDDAYAQFVEAVLEGRDLSREQLSPVADGRVLTGRQAKESGLVDVLGDYEQAIRIAAQMAGVKGEPVRVRQRKRGLRLWDLVSHGLERVGTTGTGWPVLEYRMR